MPKNKFWKFQNKTANSAELMLYGDIASEKSWFGDEITPNEFLSELKELEDVDEITVRINSGGGDVFAAQAIGNYLEQNKATVTAKIDGVCASAATIVACHCDKVVAANDSTYMIHPVKMGVFDYVGEEDLRNYTNALKVIRENILSLYAKKTGKEKDEVAELMDATSWWTGAEAKEQGFVDELTDDDANAVVENRGGMLFVNSVGIGVPFDKAPKFVQDSLKATRADGCFVNNHPAGYMPDNGHKEVNDMAQEFKTAADLRGAFPALVDEIEQAAAENARNAERARIQEIEDMALPGSEEITNDAKFVNPVSASDYAKAAMKRAKTQGSTYMQNAAADSENSGAVNVGNAKPEDSTNDEFMAAIQGLNKKQ